jgi:5-formyltetrahydrofolate cyclo-ligase
MRRWEEVRAWRKAQRETLIGQRLSVPRDERARCDKAISARLGHLLPALEGQRSIGVYWPFKGEYDARPLMRSLHLQGVRLSLPVVVERARPLVFREWWPGIRMVPGIWGIPVPAEGNAVLPDVLLAPLVGFDAGGYRLGYGGGYYDRTLAALPERPLVVGVGFETSGMETIHPQPHDIPMDLIVTERRTIRIGDAAARRMGGSTMVDIAGPTRGHETEECQ